MFWIAAALIAGMLYAGYRWRADRGLPPGPWGVPVLGYLPWLDPAEPYKTLTALARRYGPTYGVQMGKHYAVVVSDPAVARAALARNELTDRTDFEVVNDIMQEHGTYCARAVLLCRRRRRLHANFVVFSNSVEFDETNLSRARLRITPLEGVVTGVIRD